MEACLQPGRFTVPVYYIILKYLCLMKGLIPFILVFIGGILSTQVYGQNKINIGFDVAHGQNVKIAEGWNSSLFKDSEIEVVPISDSIKNLALGQYDAIVLFSPTKVFTETEIKNLVRYVEKGGSLLVIFDEERRTPLNVGINQVITPFGISLTENIPVRHNCGAVTTGDTLVCKGIRELPFSGGRSVKGGTVISKVYDEGDYVHAAYQLLKRGNKIIVMSDGMAGLLLGSKDGIRFSGTNPSDSKYWGKDSELFMWEIIQFLVTK